MNGLKVHEKISNVSYIKLNLSLDGVDLLWESDSSLSLLKGESLSVLLRQGSSQSSGLLWSQVLWNVLLTSVESSDVLSLKSSDDSQNSSDVSSDNTDLRNCWSGQLLDLQGSQLLLQLEQLLLQLLLGLGSQFCNLNTGLIMLVMTKTEYRCLSEYALELVDVMDFWNFGLLDLE